MPVTLSTIPKKTTKRTKKQDDATHTYKSNANGPGQQQPQQPPYPESDATDENDETSAGLATSTATTATTATPGSATTTATATTPATTTATTTTTATPGSATTGTKQKSKNGNLAQRLEVNQLLSQMYPSKHMTQKVAALEALNS